MIHTYIYIYIAAMYIYIFVVVALLVLDVTLDICSKCVLTFCGFWITVEYAVSVDSILDHCGVRCVS